jgi:hypothetical protein
MKTCEGCGVNFETSNPRVRFHSKSCGIRAAHAKRRAVVTPDPTETISKADARTTVERFLEQPEVVSLNHMIRDRIVSALERVL